MDTPNIGSSPTATLVVTPPLSTASLTIMSQNGSSSSAARSALNNKYSYSAPASPASSNVASSTSPVTPSLTPNQRNSLAGSPTSTNSSLNASYHAAAISALSALSTPKKHLLDAVRLEALRKLRSPNPNCELQSLRLEHAHEPVNVIKGRYLITARDNFLTNGSGATAKNTAPLFRHRVDLTSSNIKCTDIFTAQEFLCKIVNEPLHKVQRAYFALSQDTEGCQSTIYGHTLIRNVHDIVPFKRDSTYLIIAPTPQPPPAAWSTPTAQEQYNQGLDNWGVYEDLHTYIRNKRRLCETEARALFHQICQTVQVCHRNGIILRDLKLKRFYFIDEARTKLQYESLEGSMILDDVQNDTLSDKIGCPLYTAPELLCPNPTYQGKPADMWSLGVILYTMLVGQYPFYERGNYNLITVIRHCHVQIPSSLSRSVRWLLLALLRKNYAERMTSAQIFISPWLKEQRPFYMYIPVDVVVGDFEDDEEESAELNDCEAMDADEEQTHLAGFIASKTPNSSNADDSAVNSSDDVGVQPLDYTSATLCSNDNVASSSPSQATSSSSSSSTSSSASSNIQSSSSTSMEVEDIEMSSST